MQFLYAVLSGFALLCHTLLFAQDDSLAKRKNSVQFKLGAYYNSNLHYLGRTDSLKSSAFFPMAELWVGKGFYINAAPIFVTNSVSSFEYEGSVATVGYRFSNNPTTFSGNIFFVKPLYNQESKLVQSALKGQLSSTFTFVNKILNVTGGGDLKISDDNIDYGATAGIDHIFRLQPGNNFIIVINPSAYAYAGTQKFTKSYYKRSNFLLFPGSEQLVTEDVNRFSILAYEFSVPTVIAKGKFQLIANPSYIIPQNLIKVEGRNDLSERGKKMFCITVGGRFSFN